MSPKKRPPTDRLQPKAQLAWARTVLTTEAAAISALADRLGDGFLAAVEALATTRGRVITCGIGKPGFIAQKLSATLASTGVPSHYVHPAEAAHGDLGRITADDTVVLLSNSGTTEELVRLLLPLRRLGCTRIALTGDAQSPLAQGCDVVVELGAIDEACPMGLVPTASSAALHAVADALAMTLAWRRDFSRSDYALLHPGGKLGRQVLKVKELMRHGKAHPVVHERTQLSEAVVVMTNTPGRPGATNVVDGKGLLVGIFTDGDLRRLAEQRRLDFAAPVKAVMSKRPRVVSPEELVLTASALMREAHVDQLPVVAADGKPVGLLDVQDLLAARLV